MPAKLVRLVLGLIRAPRQRQVRHRTSRAGRRRKLQPEFLPDFNDAGNVLLLLRTKGADFLEETLEPRRRDNAHEPAGRLA